MARGSSSSWLGSLLLLALLVGVVVAAYFSISRTRSAEATLPPAQQTLFPVQRGSLVSSLVCTGYVRGADAILVECEVQHVELAGEGNDRRPTVTWIIEEGTRVKKGDRLLELDRSLVQEQILDQEGVVAEAESKVAQTREQLKVAEIEAEAVVLEAKVGFDQAKLALDEYMQGKFPVDVATQQQQIKVAETEVANAQDTLVWSDRLVKEGFITPAQVNADRLMSQRAEVGLETAKETLQLMQTYDHRRQVMQLQSDLKQKEFLLAKAKFDGQSNVRSMQSQLLAAQKTHEREQEKLDQLYTQLDATLVVSPVDGIVVQEATYEGDDDDEPLVVGSTVRYKQDLFYVIQGTALAVELKAPISKAGLLQVGQKVYVTPEGYPDLKLRGHIERVGLMPTAHYRSPDLKWYEFDVRLEEDLTASSIGMNCSGEVILDRIDEATLVPVAAIRYRPAKRNEDRKPYVLVADGKQFQERDVKLALDDTRMVQVISGVSPGEQVVIPPEMVGDLSMLHTSGAE